ncbi:MAG TPA: KpsF/GutQ family sugar-phosphate isomerase [Candidatus Krumholzibacterium sp.]|nr:KpsF/GutQ family sugar-phosphate isomerase [Candidatus Krumholzibacterium sp.]
MSKERDRNGARSQATRETDKEGRSGIDLAAAGREVVSLEIEGLEQLRDSIGEEFEKAARLILGCRGKVIVCGIGKSGIVARKISATLSSTGTPSVFLHPVEAAHGDVGMVTASDIFLAVSKSGGDGDFSTLLPYLRERGVPIISITGNPASQLATASEVVLAVNIDREACSMDIVPTTSTTVSLALGDALAVAVFRRRDFSREDFARLHPSGILGKRLLLTTGELMHSGEEIPLVPADTLLKDALIEIMDKRLGCTGVTGPDGRLEGLITDGDLKRILVRDPQALSTPVSRMMTTHPVTIEASVLAVDALEKMEMNPGGPITLLFVTDTEGRPEGLIHIHDIIRAGLK